MNKDSEKYIEKKLCEAIKKRGGKAIKLVSPYTTGLPDRLILLGAGQTLFVELKSKGQKPTELQRAQMSDLQRRGYWVVVLDSMEALQILLTAIDYRAQKGAIL